MTVEEMFDAIASRLVADNDRLEQARMFGSVGLRTESGKFAGFARGDDLVVKLPAERVSELLESGEGSVFDAGRGRPMKEWIVLHPPNEAVVERYLLEARKFVAKG